jgi:hypothetical protein
LDLSRRVGRGDIWQQQWELVENKVYNKPNGCSATGALAPGLITNNNTTTNKPFGNKINLLYTYILVPFLTKNTLRFD